MDKDLLKVSPVLHNLVVHQYSIDISNEHDPYQFIINYLNSNNIELEFDVEPFIRDEFYNIIDGRDLCYELKDLLVIYSTWDYLQIEEGKENIKRNILDEIFSGKYTRQEVLNEFDAYNYIGSDFDTSRSTNIKDDIIKYIKQSNIFDVYIDKFSEYSRDGVHMHSILANNEDLSLLVIKVVDKSNGETKVMKYKVNEIPEIFNIPDKKILKSLFLFNEHIYYLNNNNNIVSLETNTVYIVTFDNVPESVYIINSYNNVYIEAHYETKVKNRTDSTKIIYNLDNLNINGHAYISIIYADDINSNNRTYSFIRDQLYKKSISHVTMVVQSPNGHVKDVILYEGSRENLDQISKYIIGKYSHFLYDNRSVQYAFDRNVSPITIKDVDTGNVIVANYPYNTSTDVINFGTDHILIMNDNDELQVLSYNGLVLASIKVEGLSGYELETTFMYSVVSKDMKAIAIVTYDSIRVYKYVNFGDIIKFV